MSQVKVEYRDLMLSETIKKTLDAFVYQIKLNKKENPATTTKIINGYKSQWNITIDEACVKLIVKVLRNEGHLICSSNKGYYYGTPEQAQAYLKELIERRNAFNASITDMENALNNCEAFQV